MNQSLVSIIIPTYNRAHLIGETLDSILAQTYTNWECIIVDDGSTDHTDEVVGAYVQKDARFKYFHRPDTHLPGGNGARNYGFLQSKGEYVNWFDSDDLMTKDRIETQLKNLKDNNFFNVCKHKNFADNDHIEFEDKHNRNIGKELSLVNFINNEIYIANTDFFCSRGSISDIKYDESVLTGHEFQMLCMYLSKGYSGIFINKVLSLRRIHDGSVELIQKNNTDLINRNKFKYNFRTYLTIKNQIRLQEKKTLLKRAAVYYLSLVKEKEFLSYKKDLLSNVKEIYGNKIWIQYCMALKFLMYSKRGKYQIKKYFKKVL